MITFTEYLTPLTVKKSVKPPKISIITSVFKGDQFIEPFLFDITRQTYFDKSELILINANSPHNEEVVINKYLKKHQNIKYSRLDKDPGVYAVWNIAIRSSQGQYITNANLDDRKHPNHLEEHVKALDENPGSDLAYADVLVTETPNEVFETCAAPSGIIRMLEYSYTNLLRQNMPHNNPVWRKSIHDRFGYFREDMLSCADFEMWLRAASQGSVFTKIDKVLSLYFRNPEGISTREETLKQAIDEVCKIRDEYTKKEDFRNFLL